MAKKHVERFLTSLVIREIQAKTSEIPFHTYQTHKKNLKIGQFLMLVRKWSHRKPHILFMGLYI